MLEKSDINSDHTSSGNFQAIQERGPGHKSVYPVDHGRYCQYITCSRHYHCFGMHPACLTCLYFDADGSEIKLWIETLSITDPCLLGDSEVTVGYGRVSTIESGNSHVR